MSQPTGNHSTPPRDSHEALALSIVRAVQHGLPGPDSRAEILESVDEVLRDEERTNERALAEIRVGFLVVAVMLGLAAHFSPELFGLERYPLSLALLTMGWAVGATALAWALRRGWYRRWLRWAVPMFDAATIVSCFITLYLDMDRQGGRMPIGTFGVEGVACTMLALSGALRLSRTAARLATVLAIVAWLVMAAMGGLPWLPSVVVAVLLFASGLLSGRVGRVVRRVVTEEVSRLRLAHMYQDAQDAINAREEVLKIVSHDLRNPLNTIGMAADVMLDFKVDDAQRTRHLQIIKRAGDRMNRLIQDLLDAARIEAGRLPIEPRPVAVTELLENAVEMMGPAAAERSLRLEAECPAGLPKAWADPDRVLQVLSNLVGNAVKFTPAGGQITIQAESTGSSLRLTVADTGAGIPPDQLPHIFGRLWQANRGDTRGIGLGLTIAKAIVEAHGQEIGVESTVGEGTRFWFTLEAVAGSNTTARDQ